MALVRVSAAIGLRDVEQLYSCRIPRARTLRSMRRGCCRPHRSCYSAPLGACRSAQRLAWALAAFAVLDLAAYLAYFVFDQWPYLRFLLPAIADRDRCSRRCAGALVRALRGAGARGGHIPGSALAIAAAGLGGARALDAFRLSDAQSPRRADRSILRVRSARSSAVIVAGEQSGAMRFDTGRPIVRWEAASRRRLTRAAGAGCRSRPVWILLDALGGAAGARRSSAASSWPRWTGRPRWTPATTHRTQRVEALRSRAIQGRAVVTDRSR